MKPENHDPVLSQVLREWKTDAPLPPRFRERVWHRIAREETTTPFTAFREWLTRPAFAFSYATALVLIGIATGFWQAHAQSHLAARDPGARYVQMVDPYQMPRH